MVFGYALIDAPRQYPVTNRPRNVAQSKIITIGHDEKVALELAPLVPVEYNGARNMKAK